MNMSQRTASPHTSPKRRAAKPGGGQSARTAPPPCPASTAKGTAGRASRFASGVIHTGPKPGRAQRGQRGKTRACRNKQGLPHRRSKKEKAAPFPFIPGPCLLARPYHGQSRAERKLRAHVRAASGPCQYTQQNARGAHARARIALRQASMPPYRNSRATPARTALGPAPASIKKKQSTIAQDTRRSAPAAQPCAQKAVQYAGGRRKVQAGNHQHMRQPGRAEHGVHLGRKGALSPNAAARATLPACRPSRRVRPLHSAARICCAAPDMPPCRPTTSTRCAAASTRRPPCGRGHSLCSPGRKNSSRHGFQIGAEPCPPAVYLRDTHCGVHTAGQVAGRCLPHHGLHLRRGACKRPGRLHHGQRINAAPKKGKARPPHSTQAPCPAGRLPPRSVSAASRHEKKPPPAKGPAAAQTRPQGRPGRTQGRTHIPGGASIVEEQGQRGQESDVAAIYRVALRQHGRPRHDSALAL